MKRLLWLAMAFCAVANAQYYNQTIIPIADGIGTSGAAIPLLNGVNTWSGAQTFTSTVTPSTTNGIVGTTAADNANAGSVGQVVSINCPVGAAAAAATSVSFTNASPTVVTWSGHTFSTSTGLANYTCPINFPGGTPPTGVSAGTNYYIIGSTVSGDTFQIADTAAHALAGTNAINTSSTGTSPTAYIGALATNGTSYAGAAVQLVAGDWDCSGLSEYQELTSLSASGEASYIDTSIATTIGNGTSFRIASGSIGANNAYIPSPVIRENISATTTVYLVDGMTFSAGTMNDAGTLRCRRMR